MIKHLALTTLALSGLLALAPVREASAQGFRPAPSAAGAALPGELDASDPDDGSGRHAETRSLNLQAGEEVELTVRSQQFDTLVRVQGPGGFSEENDDADGEGTNSRLRFRAPRAGAYRVVVTSYAPGETGRYELSINRGGAAMPGAVMPGAARPGCASGACPMPNNSVPAYPGYVQPQPQQPVYPQGAYPTPGQYGWVFDPSVGQFVPVQPPAGNFAPGAPGAVAPQAALPAANGFAPGVIMPLPPNSVAVAPSGDNGIDGNDGSDGSDNGPEQPGVAQPNAGTGTVYGVFVGVSDYGGSNNLQYTAEDARRLAAGFERSGLIRRGNAVVLTDAQATPANVSQAIRTVGQRVTERDTFVFFFDGHGSANEIVLRSGSMNERYLSNLLDGVRGRQLLVLDSCHSGSLADIVRGRPNRTGLFSSEANQLSYVADELNAGGYLAHAMIEAVEGAGDRNGDGVVQLDELAAHAQQVYAQHASGRQNLVVASGAGRAPSLWRSAGGGNNAVAMNEGY